MGSKSINKCEGDSMAYDDTPIDALKMTLTLYFVSTLFATKNKS